jgi:hypothetical protein
MEQFQGESLAIALMILETVKNVYAGLVTPTPDDAVQLSPNLGGQQREETEQDLRMAQVHLSKCGLPTATATLDELRQFLLAWKTQYFANMSARDMVTRIEEIERTIKREMRSILFMYVPADRAARYNKPELFGPVVAAKFPSAKFDIAESGNCFATGRFTACVFHLMRALEVSLAGFAGIFQVPADHTNWHNIIESLESKIRDMGKATIKAPAWKEKQEFYSQAANSFMFFKDAWRNYTAHARGKYTELEADTIYRNVNAFMQKLAEGGIAE